MLAPSLWRPTLLCLLVLFASLSRGRRGCGEDGDDHDFDPSCFPNTNSNDDDKDLSGGAIAGIVVGSVAALAALLAALWFWRRRRRIRARQDVDLDPESASVPVQTTTHVAPGPLLATILRATHGRAPSAKAGANTDFRSIPNDGSHAEGHQSDLRALHSSSEDATSPLHSEMAAYQSMLKEDFRHSNVPVDAVDPPPMYQSM